MFFVLSCFVVWLLFSRNLILTYPDFLAAPNPAAFPVAQAQ